MHNSVSQSITKYTFPSNTFFGSSFTALKKYLIQRLSQPFDTSLSVAFKIFQTPSFVANTLKSFPNFVPFAFDISTQIEKWGDRQTANKIRKLAAGVIKMSLPSSPPADCCFLNPPLTGKYPVGVKSFFLEDSSRNEQDLGHNIKENLNRLRRFEFDVYYPGEQVEAPSYKVHPSIYKANQNIHKENEKLDNLYSRSQPGIKPSSQEKFPVVIFSHGLGCNHEDYQQLLEELASKGFCVLVVNHPFSNGFCFFTGNYPDQNHLEEIERERLNQEVVNNSNDIAYLIEQITHGQIEGFHDFLGNHITIEAIGVFGHSLGGAASLRTCRVVPSILAGINMDGLCNAEPISEIEIHQPFLTIIAGSNEEVSDQEEEKVGWKMGRPMYPKHKLAKESVIKNAVHMDFTFNALIGAQFESREPSKRAMKVYREINDVVVDFFTKHLKSKQDEFKSGQPN